VTRPDDVVVRRAAPTDRPAIMELAAAALGWTADQPNEALFAWKHEQNPFGRSPAWVAEVDGRLAGFRTFVRWEFERAGGGLARAVRAVDTATHPDFQGRGIFTRLTLGALDDLRSEGVDFVFNTPNDQSRPGYLKMGWKVVGRLPVRVRPASPLALVRMVRARVPAGKWSLPCTVSHDPATVLADARVEALLASQPPTIGLRTRRSPEFLRWRYGLESLHYRVLVADDDPGRGLLVFRLRPRGSAIEVVIADVLATGGDGRIERSLVRQLRQLDLGDYLIRIDRRRRPPGGFWPLPGQGPILTWRAVREQEMLELDAWDVRLGDIELF
jgi:GNAT superfamily N-acetyltransferase